MVGVTGTSAVGGHFWFSLVFRLFGGSEDFADCCLSSLTWLSRSFTYLALAIISIDFVATSFSLASRLSFQILCLPERSGLLRGGTFAEGEGGL